MTSKARRRELRRQRVETARTQWQDAEFGLRVESGVGNGHNRTRVSWLVDREPAIALMGAVRMRGLVSAMEAEAVVSARVAGLTWDEIGWALGISGEAARKRYPEADAAADAVLAEEVAR